MQFVRSTVARNAFSPFFGIDQLVFVGGDPTQPQTHVVADNEPLRRNGRTFGTFSVTMTGTVDGQGRNLTITATGYFPDVNRIQSKATVEAVVKLDTSSSEVFDYGYFINNWGWFYGDSIFSNGNARSNGQFDAGDYAPQVNGTPRYDSINGSDLLGYKDDNSDGVMDGSDGGIYAGWDVIRSGNVGGLGGLSQNQHDFQEQIPMPNLNDLSNYEAKAIDYGSSLRIGGQVDAFGNPLPDLLITSAVQGDDLGESRNLVLVGTPTQPIIIDGPVVIRGDVIIKGTITGQGTIYAGRNVYIPDNVEYASPPSTYFPMTTSEADTEAWIAANTASDFLGLFAAEHVVMGDFTDNTWRSYVGGWLSNSMNLSAEDSGTDFIPNTFAGRDGVPGTEDDDVLEADGLWTVEYYSPEDADLGIIPPGFAIGDPIPGTGEDIDGDGLQDGTTTLAEFDLGDPLSAANWDGNLPTGVSTYGDLSSMTMTRVDGALYTNHTAALVTLDSGQSFDFFGSLVSRNESIVYGTAALNMNHDRRLQGGGGYGDMLPETVNALRILSWRSLEERNVHHDILQLYPPVP